MCFCVFVCLTVCLALQVKLFECVGQSVGAACSIFIDSKQDIVLGQIGPTCSNAPNGEYDVLVGDQVGCLRSNL